MNSAGGTPALRLFSASMASGMVKTCSSGVPAGAIPTEHDVVVRVDEAGITVFCFKSTRRPCRRGQSLFPPRQIGRSGSCL
jgi:hypothetical protein